MYLAVIPAFNEANSIAKIVRETKKYVDQVIVVDDSSGDNTRELARRLGAIVLHHSKNRGVGATMITGIAYAQKLKPGDVLWFMLSVRVEGHNDVRLMHPIISGRADWVLGSRFLQRPPANITLVCAGWPASG